MREIMRSIKFARSFNFSVLLSGMILPVIATAASAAPLKFAVDDYKKANRDIVSFTSDAPIELIVGNTTKVSGTINIDDSMDLSKKPLEATFDVDLASIDTGIPLRNEHMRDNFLHTNKFPKANFKLKSLGAPVVLKPGQKTKIQAIGDFTLHGKTVSKTVPVYVTWFKKCAATEQKRPGCDLLQISAEFPVAFKDHEIPRPEIVFQKLSDTVIVKVGATGYSTVSEKSTATENKTPAAKPAAASADNSKGKTVVADSKSSVKATKPVNSAKESPATTAKPKTK